MAERTDITVRPDLSPRLIIVAAPSTELTIQDLHDTAIAWHDSPPNHDYEKLITSEGKANLGGGSEVDITSTLQNAQVMFEPRNTDVSAGTVTTPDSAGLVLTDSAGDFTSTVTRGDLVLNVTDGAHGTVLEVVSDTELHVLAMEGGSDNQFDSADAYKVFDVAACNISGGNLVAVDDVGGDISSTLSSFGTSIVRTSSSSGTVQNLDAIQRAAFDEHVSVDTANTTGLAQTGVLFPAGTRGQPCLNMTDALAIATSEGLTKFKVIGNLTLNDAGLALANKTFAGSGITQTAITVDSAAAVANCGFTDATITGTLDGGSSVEDCAVGSIAYVNGRCKTSELVGPITLGGGADAKFDGCTSSGIVSIDLGGSGQGLNLSHFSGEVQLSNKTGADLVHVNLDAGSVTLDADVDAATLGDITITGVGGLTNNATNPSSVISENLLSGRDLTIVTEQTRYRVEALRGARSGNGEVFFWDPVNGDDSNDGQLKDAALLTWTAVNALIVAGRRDVVFMVSAADVTVTDRITLNKAGTILRGSRNITFDPGDDAGPTISIQADQCEVSGFSVTSTGATAQPAIEVTGPSDNVSIVDMRITDTTGRGIDITGGSDHEIVDCVINSTGLDAVAVVDSFIVKIRDCRIENAIFGMGVLLTATVPGDTSHVSMRGCVFHSNSAGSVSIGSGVRNTVLFEDCINDKTLIDNGTNTYYATGLLRNAQSAQIVAWPSSTAATAIGGLGRAITDIWQRLGLDPNEPFTYSHTDRKFSTASGSVVIDVSGDGADIATETRQP